MNNMGYAAKCIIVMRVILLNVWLFPQLHFDEV